MEPERAAEAGPVAAARPWADALAIAGAPLRASAGSAEVPGVRLAVQDGLDSSAAQAVRPEAQVASDSSAARGVPSEVPGASGNSAARSEPDGPLEEPDGQDSFA